MKARIIWTPTCHRTCSYCCNKSKIVQAQMTPLEVVRSLNATDISGSGGEPMLYPGPLVTFLRALRECNPRSKIYLYSARWSYSWRSVISLVDGVQFSVHRDVTSSEALGLELFQSFAIAYPDKSFRLNLESRIERNLTITPRAWSRIELKEMLSLDSCAVPDYETLYIWRGQHPHPRVGWCTLCGERAQRCVCVT